MLIVDGVKYELWIPKDEEKDFHPIVKEHSDIIFGEDTKYFDVSLKLKSISGLGSKPDGCVLNFKDNYWYIVEVELSKHDPYDHIVNQLTRFINGIENPKTKNDVVDILYDEIDKNKMLRAYVEEKVGKDIHHWLSKLISQTPIIVVVIEKKTDKVIEACKILSKYETYILELNTFVRQDAPNVHAHLIESLFEEEKQITGMTRKQISLPSVSIPLISKGELNSLKEGNVLIAPSTPDGVDFLIEKNAWGFIRIKRKADYFALYVGSPESRIMYFGKVEKIVDPRDTDSPISIDEARQYDTYKEGKKVVILKPNSLRELDDKILLGLKRAKMRNQKFVALTRFINSKTIDDL